MKRVDVIDGVIIILVRRRETATAPMYTARLNRAIEYLRWAREIVSDLEDVKDD